MVLVIFEGIFLCVQLIESVETIHFAGSIPTAEIPSLGFHNCST